MPNKVVQPSTLQGEVLIPPSKSLVHRAIISASLAQGTSTITNIQLSEDVKATIEGMKAFGADIRIEGEQARIKGIDDFTTYKERTVDCNESGSTLRFLMPLATLFEGPTTFTGRGELVSRSLDTYEEIFHDQGVSYQSTDSFETTVEGHLKPGDYRMPGDVLPHFITGMLFALPLLEDDSTLTMTSPLKSVDSVQLTLNTLKRFGITIDHNNYRTFKITGNQSYQAKKHTIEGDFSHAAFFLSAGALGSDLRVEGLNTLSQQRDREIVDILEAFGAEVDVKESSLQARANQLVGGFEVDASLAPILMPITLLIASLAKGQTVINHLDRLIPRDKAHLKAAHKELIRLGAQIVESEDGKSLHIEGQDQLVGGVEVWSYNDHYLAMMLAIASTRCQEDITVVDSQCVAKSYPDFWQDFEELGGKTK